MLELNMENVRELFNECTGLEGNERKEELVHVMMTGTGLAYVLSKVKVEENKAKIAELIAGLPNLAEGAPFTSLKTNKDGIVWSDRPDDLDVEKLTTLGVAAELLDYLIPEGCWSEVDLLKVEYREGITIENLKQLPDGEIDPV